MNDDKSAKIDYEKCVACGACVYQCPWGAINDKSYILDVVKLIKNSNNNANYKVYAVIAPSIASQFVYAKLGQVIAGIKALGFYSVEEAALGADIVAFAEAKELVEKGFLTSSCCPAFVSYVKKQFPDLSEYISHNLSPMATIAKSIKEKEPNAKVVFIGPCTAKKMEFKQESVRDYVDTVITFEELQALFDSKNIEIESLSEENIDSASYYGRIFGRSCGLTEAVAESIKERGLDGFDLKAVPCDGLEACRVALLKASKRILDGNFIEGMACVGGCIGGAGCLTHGDVNKLKLDKHGRLSSYENITNAIDNYTKK
jgi:iron only hydrogenase large subunit-like protein